MGLTHDDGWAQQEQYDEAFEEWCHKNSFDPGDIQVQLAFEKLMDGDW